LGIMTQYRREPTLAISLFGPEGFCLKKAIKKSKSGDGIFGKVKKHDKTIITDFSVDGSFAAYTGIFDKDFVKNTLSKRDDIDFIEDPIAVKATYAVNLINLLEKRTVQSNAPFNLDRIDQKDFPLDGNYNFPTNAGSGVNIYVVDTVEQVLEEVFALIAHQLMIMVKVLNQDGQGSSLTVTAGLSFVIDQHKKSSNKNTIINLSLAGAFSQAINTMVSQCSNAGIHVVVSAGDGSGDACKASPASAPQAITVGATEKSSNNITSFTNTGSCVKIFAPGRDIIAAGAFLADSLSQASGTSQACPHVAGTVALIISKKGNMSPSSMVNELITSSTKNILKNATPNIFLRVPSP
ncbi:13131_t:CDS:2, partial [Rhizophagus irregularis]